ncbi:MAG: hypothetical protein A2087_14645 [Spirochaetes bacterium GWD1_61_31]|nr:MAG: hypothetical protein A2Y37_09315 [Spirochaetes bacterium GWB1_60_80]OHD31616.1 MAG: hypothetical protein A2004_09530 [Spirochaetes bacterium GWC1_61_12]OHD35014.1 MAG: hypothetical protein A2087_14645 [Spirochaetes bacterium GWD1_61_31]OHD44038.1 MAG: hypothetical protein A2Y35_01735 [Spirochaetes bacterium GWE1_60_18]OHD59073.1 MAG: hypothetical protein A2Y32_02455 [Spirochaetes bacterium GWF1_60_12]HAP42604.1 metallophosphoesterase [Spirochaetaceae bacterium]
MSVNILYLAEIVGKGGIFAVKRLLPGLKAEFGAAAVIANANGATGGAGLGKAHALYLRKLGIDVVTTGEAAFFKKDILEVFPKSHWLLRPENYPTEVPGRGVRIVDLGGFRLAVMQLLGQSGFSRVHLANPFRLFDELYPRLKAACDAILVDFHAATTAEKNSFFQHVAGRAAAVIGSNARTQTADARILSPGTAVITDAGRCGSLCSVGGLDAGTRIAEYLSGIPSWAKDSSNQLEVQAVLITLEVDGRASAIRSLRLPCKEAFND